MPEIHRESGTINKRVHRHAMVGKHGNGMPPPAHGDETNAKAFANFMDDEDWELESNVDDHCGQHVLDKRVRR